MSWSLDARIPVRLLHPSELTTAMVQARTPFALLAAEAADLTRYLPGPSPALHAALARFAPGGPRHAAACACCAGRPPVGVALDRLFQARTRGTCTWFETVLAVVPDDAARQEVEAALMADPLSAARFRPG